LFDYKENKKRSVTYLSGVKSRSDDTLLIVGEATAEPTDYGHEQYEPLPWVLAGTIYRWRDNRFSDKPAPAIFVSIILLFVWFFCRFSLSLRF